MNDTRINQALALLDDARCLLDDIVEEGVNDADTNHLTAAIQFTDGAITHTQAVLPRCTRQPLGGGRCELAENHAGEHERVCIAPDGVTPYTFRWTDESQMRLAAQHGSRFD